MKILSALILVTPVAALADQAEITTYGPLLVQCYEVAEGIEAKQQCIGTMSGVCMSQEEGGETTLGITICTHSETQVWDRFLNEEYQKTMTWAKAADADDQQYFPEFANRVKSLRDAQRAWIVFRDAECGLEYAVWGAGSMRQIAGNSCMMEMTAQRTIELLSVREMMQ